MPITATLRPGADRSPPPMWCGASPASAPCRIDGGRKPSRLTRRPALASIANGSGGFVTLYGGKLTTHRAFAETVLDELRGLGA